MFFWYSFPRNGIENIHDCNADADADDNSDDNVNDGLPLAARSSSSTVSIKWRIAERLCHWRRSLLLLSKSLTFHMFTIVLLSLSFFLYILNFGEDTWSHTEILTWNLRDQKHFHEVRVASVPQTSNAMWRLESG